MLIVDINLTRKNFDLAINEQFPVGITGIFGPSGAGKSSMLHAISGLVKPDKGRISINERILFDTEKQINVPIDKRNIGYLFQEGRLFPHMSVERNLKYGIKAKTNSVVNFDEVVHLLNLEHLLPSRPATISGGERQRTALGRSLLSSPDILLLDEPFSAVDTNLRKQILPFIIRIQKTVQLPILVVSHDLPDLLKLSGNLCLIKNGECAGHNEYYELLRSPEAAEMIKSNVLVNTINMEVIHQIPGNKLTMLRWADDSREVIIKCDQKNKIYSEGENVSAFIDADDIALSTQRLDHLSIQNQIKGTITDIIQQNAAELCVVDVGFKLVVKITEDSLKRMDLSKGSIVWCLFKSVAIDVVG